MTESEKKSLFKIINYLLVMILTIYGNEERLKCREIIERELEENFK